MTRSRKSIPRRRARNRARVRRPIGGDLAQQASPKGLFAVQWTASQSRAGSPEGPYLYRTSSRVAKTVHPRLATPLGRLTNAYVGEVPPAASRILFQRLWLWQGARPCAGGKQICSPWDFAEPTTTPTKGPPAGRPPGRRSQASKIKSATASPTN